ncbi:hypothetical protein N9174_04265 [bacterium]|nr:hypothetical protein [bacterium]
MSSQIMGKLISVAMLIVFFFVVLLAVTSNAQIKDIENEMNSVLVKEISFTGNTLIETDTLQKLTEEFKNRELTFDEMNGLAELITLEYQERGYMVAKAFIPEQEIKDGVLKVTITEGNVGKIMVVGNKYYKDRVLTRNFQPLVKHGVIKESTLERAYLLTNDLPSAETNVVLEPGGDPGTVDVILKTKDKTAVSLGLDYNNYGSEVVGENRFGAKFDVTDPWLGSTLSLRVITSREWGDTALGTADWTIPVNNYGTKFGVGALTSNYAVVGVGLADLGFEGDSTFYHGNLTHPFLKKRDKNLSGTLGYEHKKTNNFQFEDILASTDETDEGYLGLNFDNLDRFLGKNFLSFRYYYGSADVDSQPPPSRPAADDRFNRLFFELSRVQKIKGYTNILLSAFGQYSPDRLLPFDGFVIGGYGTVRGQPPFVFIGDSGYAATAELMFAPPFLSEKVFLGQRVGEMVQIALFFDAAGTWINDASLGQSDRESLQGYGAGLRLYYKDWFRFRFDVGFPVDRLPETEVPNAKGVYYYFMASLNF